MSSEQNQPLKSNEDLFEDALESNHKEQEAPHVSDLNNPNSTSPSQASAACPNNEADTNANNNDEFKLPPYFKSAKEENGNPNNDSDNEESIECSSEEKEKMSTNIIANRAEAGKFFKQNDYLQALNIYSLSLKDARKYKCTDQISILYCNRGICFNKLNDKEKALKDFTKAIEHNKNYSKAMANRFLIYYNKGDYLEALEDFNRLKEVDKVLWQTYAPMEYSLQQKAEVKKKEMTDDMLGKLKDMGNSILGYFDMSLDNFKMIPNGQGGYSVQYQNK